MQRSAGRAKTGKLSTPKATGRCVCGDVKFEIDYPAFWAWHDHSDASRRAQGCAYATYVGTWRSRFRVLEGSERLTRFDEPKARAKRSFCARCGTPLFYERASAPKWVNIPRALFSGRTGREPRMSVTTCKSHQSSEHVVEASSHRRLDLRKATERRPPSKHASTSRSEPSALW